MPEATVRGVRLNYATFGTNGPWVTFNPGGRRSFTELVPLAEKLAARGLRVLLHDRRNCGSSDVSFDGPGTEADIWADDMIELHRSLGALPTYIGGSSSGARLAITAALRHPDAVSGLLLWRLTAGRAPAQELADNYYDQYIPIARAGGMAAICQTEHFAACIRARPANRDRLMAMDPGRFVTIMEEWSRDFMATADMPVVGATEAELRSLRIPVCLILGNDRIHHPDATRRVHAMIPQSELHELVRRLPEDQLLPHFDAAEWQAKTEDMANIFAHVVERAA